VLSFFALKLPAIDVVRFSRVCKIWHEIAQSMPTFIVVSNISKRQYTASDSSNVSVEFIDLILGKKNPNASKLGFICIKNIVYLEPTIIANKEQILFLNLAKGISFDKYQESPVYYIDPQRGELEKGPSMSVDTEAHTFEAKEGVKDTRFYKVDHIKKELNLYGQVFAFQAQSFCFLAHHYIVAAYSNTGTAFYALDTAWTKGRRFVKIIEYKELSFNSAISSLDGSKLFCLVYKIEASYIRILNFRPDFLLRKLFKFN
jgi:hypothetical protein